MKRFIKESQLVSRIKKLILEEVEEVKISPQEYKDLLKKVAGQAHGMLKLPKFRGKKLVVTGDLNLRDDKRITDLGPIRVEGDLDVTNTNIKSLENVEVTGYARYWHTPWTKELDRRKRQRELADAEERREEDAWNLNDTDNEGERANAAFEYAVALGLLKARTEEEEIELRELKTKLSELETQMDQEEDEERYDELSNEFDEIQERVDELEVNIPMFMT